MGNDNKPLETGAGGQFPRRRRFLKTVGAGVAGVSLAGCGGGDGDGDTTTTPGDTTTGGGNGDGDTTTTTTTGTPLDSAYTDANAYPDPSQVQFNPYNLTNQYAMFMLYDPLAHYSPVDQEFLPMVASEWDFSGDTISLTLDDRYAWTNGAPVTTEDVDIWLTLETAFDGPITNYVTDWTVDSDTEMTLTKADADLNPTILQHRVLTQTPNTPRDLWSDYMEEFPDPPEDTLNQISTRQIGTDEVVSNSIYQFSRFRGTEAAEFTKREEGHPHVDNCQVPEFEFANLSAGAQQRVPALRNGTIDNSRGNWSDAVQASLPDHVVNTVTWGMGGAAHYTNHDHEWFQHKEVRQAVGYIINNEEIAGNNNALPPGPRLCGYSNSTMKETWLGEVLPSFTNYMIPQEEAYSRAAELLREAGLEEGDRWWQDSSGNVLRVPSKGISGWSGAMIMNQTIVTQLRDFGINAESIGIEANAFFDQHWRNGNFVAAKTPIGQGVSDYRHPHYYAYYAFASEAANNSFNGNHDYEIPYPIGDTEGATETVTPADLVSELRVTQDSTREKELVQELAWIANQGLPVIENTQEMFSVWWTTDEWNIPQVNNSLKPPDVYRKWPANRIMLKQMLMRGHVTPKYE